MVEEILTHLIEPFRIGLIVALFYTAKRTEHTLPPLIPLLLGIVFVAVLIPMTLGNGEAPFAPRTVVAGVIANFILLGAIWLVDRGVRSLTQRG